MSKLTDHKFIVFCGDNGNSLGLCRSLGEKGIDPIVVLYVSNPYLINHCKYVKHIYHVESIEAGLDLIIAQWGNESLKPFLYTMDEDVAQLLDQRYDDLIDHFYFFHSGKQGRLTYYLDKKHTCDLAEGCGIPQPKGEVLKKGELPKTLRYPVLTKVTMSTKGAWKDDVYVCNNEDELKEAYTHIVADELLVQEFIDKKNELCIDGVSIRGGEEIFFSYTSEYLRMSKQSFGNYMLMKQYDNQEVKDKLAKILRRTHYSGIFDAECLIGQNDELYFLEINFRNSGWSYAHTFGGVNLPYLWAKWTSEGKINPHDCALREKPFTAMGELGDLSYVLHSHEISLWTWIKQFRSCECTYLYNAQDPWPFYTAIWRRIKVAIKHKMQSLFGKYTYQQV